MKLFQSSEKKYNNSASKKVLLIKTEILSIGEVFLPIKDQVFRSFFIALNPKLIFTAGIEDSIFGSNLLSVFISTTVK